MSYQIHKVGVIGAGTMGAAIAAHVANAGFSVILLDMVPTALTPQQAQAGLTLDDRLVRNSVVTAGFDRLKQAKPTPLMSRRAESLITLGNLADDFELLADADWIIEVIVEALAPKQALMQRLETVCKPNAIITSNTSGLPITAIGQHQSDAFKARFFGTHFFNPPRYMKLLEIIAPPAADPDAVQTIADFCRRRLGKGVVYCKDTPNFIGNRLMAIDSSFILNYAFSHSYSVEEVDAVTGPLIGRPKTATFRLLDLIGADVWAHVTRNLYALIPDDPHREILAQSAVKTVIDGLLDHGWLGRKSGQGFYKRAQDQDGNTVFTALNPGTLAYEMPQNPRFESIDKVRKIEDVGARLKALFGPDWQADRAAKLAWAVVSNQLVYAAFCLPEIADDLISIDHAMRWGFSYQLGPFELWDKLGVPETVAKMQADGLPVPAWVVAMAEAGDTFYRYDNGLKTGYYNPASRAYTPIPVEPDVIDVDSLRAAGHELARNNSASILTMGDGVLLLEFHAKMNTIDADTIKMMFRAAEMLTENRFVGLVIGNRGTHFCAGANLLLFASAAEENRFEEIDRLIADLQTAVTQFRYSPKPVVTAPFGMVLGGGAEVMLGGARRVAHAESYIGLVEVGVGLIPAGSGTKEMIRRLVNPAMRAAPNSSPLPVVQRAFQTIGMAKVSTSAAEAGACGFLGQADRIVMNRDCLLVEAKREVLAMVREGYTPPAPTKLFAAGRDTLAALKADLWMMKQGNYLSEYDQFIGQKLAYVLCGGNLSSPQWVDEQYMLDLERETFIELLKQEKTIARIWHMLQNGKPLKN